MSYFEQQQAAWFANDCQGNPTDYGPLAPSALAVRPVKVKTSAMRDRSTLAMTRLEEFAKWAEVEGFKREPTKGDYEVLRLRYPSFQPYIFFQRIGAQHATSQAEGTQLVRRWLRSRNGIGKK